MPSDHWPPTPQNKALPAPSLPQCCPLAPDPPSPEVWSQSSYVSLLLTFLGSRLFAPRACFSRLGRVSLCSPSFMSLLLGQWVTGPSPLSSKTRRKGPCGPSSSRLCFPKLSEEEAQLLLLGSIQPEDESPWRGHSPFPGGGHSLHQSDKPPPAPT